MKSSLFRALGPERSLEAFVWAAHQWDSQRRGTRGGGRGAMFSHLCGQVALCWSGRCPRASSSSRWSRCCPGRRTPRSSRTVRTRRSSPRRSAAGWRASRTAKVLGKEETWGVRKPNAINTNRPLLPQRKSNATADVAISHVAEPAVTSKTTLSHKKDFHFQFGHRSKGTIYPADCLMGRLIPVTLPCWWCSCPRWSVFHPERR